MDALERDFGDGNGYAPEGQGFFLNKHVPWLTKEQFVALSNGCFKPEKLTEEWAVRIYGDVDGADMDEAAHQATIEYMRQNYIYQSLVDMAAKKDDKSLLISLTATPHFVTPNPETEKKHVPLSYFEDGLVTGLATDEAFAIVERITGGFDENHSYDEGKTRQVTHMLNVLERQVKKSSTITELEYNFFHALDPDKKIVRRKALPAGAPVAESYFMEIRDAEHNPRNEVGYAKSNPQVMVLMDRIVSTIVHTKVTSRRRFLEQLSYKQILDEILFISTQLTAETYPYNNAEDTPREEEWQRLLRYFFDAMVKTRVVTMEGADEVEKRRQAAYEVVPKTLSLLDNVFKHESYNLYDRWRKSYRAGVREE